MEILSMFSKEFTIKLISRNNSKVIQKFHELHTVRRINVSTTFLFKGWKNPDRILLRNLSQIVDNCLKSPIDKAISEMIESPLQTMTRLEARMISLLWLHLLSRSLVAIMNTMNKIKHWTT